MATAFTLDSFLSSLGLDDSGKMALGCLRHRTFTSTPAYRQRHKVIFDLLNSERHQLGSPEARLLAERYAVGATACHDAAMALTRLDADGGLLGPWSAIIDSLAHMHINRMIGVDRAGELEIYGLLSGTLRSVLHSAGTPVAARTRAGRTAPSSNGRSNG